MKTRILAAIPIALILIAALVLQSFVLLALVIFLSIIAQKEMLGALSSDGTVPVKSIAYIFAAVTPVFAYFHSTIIIFAYMIMIILLFIVCMFGKKYDFKSFTSTLLCTLYPQFFFVFIYLLIYGFMNMDFIGSNPFPLLMAVIPPIFSDIFAYFIGMAFGKKKLCPEISPKKTVAGAWGGIIGGVIAGVLIWLFFASGIVFGGLTWDMGVVAIIIMGAIVAFISQLGDLSASFIKRHYGIKDYGNLIPGHGGILDRMDSILFSVPVVYIFMIIHSLFV